ncbi:MAG: sulfurtransferase [Acetobacteraceae bacterium]|nr:sulfurtransferase [Acetobacteraceae bacterium]
MQANDVEFLIDAQWLAARSGDPAVILIDTRPPAEYWEGHLEGARHFDPFPFHHSDTGDAGMNEFNGQLAWIFSALGITGRETVVFYENESGMRATRGAWLLEYMGHPSVRILDGGLNRLAEAKLITTPVTVTPSNFQGTPQAGALATYKYIAGHLGHQEVQIFDVRSDEEYFGERIRARHGGAIPGAIHRDWRQALDESGAFKPVEQLRAEFERMGLRPEREIIPYCQGGYRSANAYYALRLAGYPRVRNYLGSWGEWGNREDLPIEKPTRRRIHS